MSKREKPLWKSSMNLILPKCRAPTSRQCGRFRNCWKKRMGRPPKDSPKVLVTSRYDADIIERLRAKGDGWQTRMNDALRTYLMEHEL